MIKPKKKIFSGGNTFIETVVYVALLAFVLVFVFSSAFSMHKASLTARVSRDINNSASSALDRVVRVIKDSKSVVVDSSTLGTSPGVLVVQSAYAIGGLGELQFYTDGNLGLMFKDGTDAEVNLLADGITVSGLVFRYLPTTHGQGVCIELTVKGGTGDYEQTKNFYSTAVLRENYI